MDLFRGICDLKILLIAHVLMIIIIFERTNKLKTAFFDKLFDQFLNLNIKILNVCKGKRIMTTILFSRSQQSNSHISPMCYGFKSNQR